MFQLAKMQRKNVSIFKRDGFYGDHTAFPGEFLLHYPFLKLSGIFESNIKVVPHGVNLEMLRVENLTKEQMTIILIPKIAVTVLGVFLFGWLCVANIGSWIGILIATLIFTFHPNLIAHGIEFRPYGILPELAIFNLLLSSLDIENIKKWRVFLYCPLIFFTFVYHAYGILIAGLPILWWYIQSGRMPRIPKIIIITFVLSFLAWAYYASFNSFGITPNHIQSKVDPFAYMPLDILPEKIISILFGHMLFYIVLAPIVLLCLIKYKRNILFLSLLIVLPIVMIIIVDLKTSYWIHPRQWIWVIPFFAIFVGKQFDYVVEK